MCTQCSLNVLLLCYSSMFSQLTLSLPVCLPASLSVYPWVCWAWRETLVAAAGLRGSRLLGCGEAGEAEGRAVQTEPCS